jgi:RHS repeat-associated protein
VFSYDHAGQMTSASKSATDGGTITDSVNYNFDAFGNRLQRQATSGSTTTTERFAYDGWDTAKPGAIGSENFDVYADLNSSNSVTNRRLFGPSFDEPIARQDSSGVVAWYGTDQLGSVRTVFDNSGTVTGARSYSGFGEITSETGTGLDRYAFTAREWDSAAGLQYSRARMYDPKLGRWTSEDPIGFGGGDANLNRYVGNSATGATDPSGLARVPNPGHVAERTIDDSRPEDRRPRDRSLKNTRDEWWKWINPLKWVGRGIQIVGRQVAEYDDANGMHRVGDMVSGVTRAMGGTIETLADFDGKTAVDMVKHTGGRAIGTAKALVSQGVYNPGAILFFVNGFVAADIIGVTPVMEGITGKDAVTGAALEGDERWERGSGGAVQVVTTAVTIGTMAGGPRVPRGANPVPKDLHGPNLPKPIPKDLHGPNVAKPKPKDHGVTHMVPDEGVKPPHPNAKKITDLHEKRARIREDNQMLQEALDEIHGKQPTNEIDAIGHDAHQQARIQNISENIRKNNRRISAIGRLIDHLLGPPSC